MADPIATAIVAVNNAESATTAALAEARRSAPGVERELRDLTDAVIQVQKAQARVTLLTLWTLQSRLAATRAGG